MSGESRQHGKTYLLAIAITVSLCALWGLAHGLYGFVLGPFYRLFELSPAARHFTDLSFQITYVIVALPAAQFLRKLGYKLAIVVGLSAFSVGAFLFYPAMAQHQVLWLVAAVIATSMGWAFLETSVNPLICRMGSPKTAVLRLNFAQAFYPLGYVLAVWLGRSINIPHVAALGAQSIETFVRPYVVVGLALLLVAFLIENIEFPRLAVTPSSRPARLRQELKTLLSQQEFRLALAAMAAAMAGLVCVMSVASGYITQVWPAEAALLVPNVSIAFWAVVGLGRFSGTALMLRFKPLHMLAVAAAACVCTLCLALVGDGLVGTAGLFGTALFLSITFPTIFGEAVRNTGELIKSASGLLVVAAGLSSMAAGNFLRWALAAGYVHLAVATAILCYGVVLVVVLAIRRLRKEILAVPQDSMIASA